MIPDLATIAKVAITAVVTPPRATASRTRSRPHTINRTSRSRFQHRLHQTLRRMRPPQEDHHQIAWPAHTHRAAVTVADTAGATRRLTTQAVLDLHCRARFQSVRRARLRMLDLRNHLLHLPARRTRSRSRLLLCHRVLRSETRTKPCSRLQ